MLNFLSIKNIVLIDSCEIELLDHGLHIFSGETGSGKSLLLNAIGLIMGKRSNSRLIGDDDDKACVAASFNIKGLTNLIDLLSDQQLINNDNKNILNIRRILHKNSNNRVFINDQLVSSQLHQQIGEHLIEIHGQFDTAGLLNQSNHRLILDAFAKNEEHLIELSKLYHQIKGYQYQLLEMEEKRNQYIREKDYLEFVINELQEADIKNDEERDLIEIKNSLKNQDLVQEKLQEIKNLCNQISNNNYNATNNTIKIADIHHQSTTKNSHLNEITNNFDQISQLIENNINLTNQLINDNNYNDHNISDIEERLFQIKNLSRKFNVNSNDLGLILEESLQKLNTINNKDQISDEISAKIAILKQKYNDIANMISKKRHLSATKLAKKVEEELKFLKMESVKFQVEVNDFDNDEINEFGLQKISFLASINNKNFDQINKIASGGELSRFMLALKIALMEVRTVPTLIFDEIDTGISGVTADAVGNRLARLGAQQQVLVVTHQPQIAAKSNTHYCIEKNKVKNKIKTTIEKLENNCKFKEVARMISGKTITDESLAAAKKLFNA